MSIMVEDRLPREYQSRRGQRWAAATTSRSYCEQSTGAGRTKFPVRTASHGGPRVFVKQYLSRSGVRISRNVGRIISLGVAVVVGDFGAARPEGDPLFRIWRGAATSMLRCKLPTTEVYLRTLRLLPLDLWGRTVWGQRNVNTNRSFTVPPSSSRSAGRSRSTPTGRSRCFRSRLSPAVSSSLVFAEEETAGDNRDKCDDLTCGGVSGFCKDFFPRPEVLARLVTMRAARDDAVVDTFGPYGSPILMHTPF